MKRLEPIAEAALAAVRALPAGPVRDLLVLQAAWVRAVGPELGRHTRPLSYAAPILWVEADDERWAKSMAPFGARIAAALQAFTELRIGELRVRAAPLRAVTRKGPVRAAPINPQGPIRDPLARALEAHAEESVRSAIKAMIEAYHDAHR